MMDIIEIFDNRAAATELWLTIPDLSRPGIDIPYRLGEGLGGFLREVVANSAS
jgi:hypothetical protein